MDVKKYLEEYKIKTAGKLVSHISELKRNTKPNLKLISYLADYAQEMSVKEFCLFEFEEHSTTKNSAMSPSQETFNKYVNHTHLQEPTRPKEWVVSTTRKKEEPNLKVRFFKKDIDTGGTLFSEDKLFSTYEEVQKYGEDNNYTEWYKLEHQIENNNGIKETKGKLYYELSWEFIEEMAKRMANNKSNKYPLFNWKKNIDVEDLKQAINRHHIEVMKGNYKDGDELLGHVVSYACNSMMLWEQLNKKLK